MALRTAYSDTFLNPNGTFTTHEYATPKYYKDGNGQWLPISTQLRPSSVLGFAFSDTTNIVKSEFASSSGGAVLAEASMGGYSASLAPVSETVVGQVYGTTGLDGLTLSGVASVGGSVYQSVYEDTYQSVYGAVYQTVGQAVYQSPGPGVYRAGAEPAHLTSGGSVEYAGIYPRVNYSYAAVPGGFKEGTELMGRPGASASFAFTIALHGLNPVLGTNDIELQNAAGHTVFVVPSSSMTDAAGHTSNDVQMTLNGDTLTLTPSSTFLASAVYPVTIDPSIVATSSAINTVFWAEATWVWQNVDDYGMVPAWHGGLMSSQIRADDGTDAGRETDDLPWRSRFRKKAGRRGYSGGSRSSRSSGSSDHGLVDGRRCGVVSHHRGSRRRSQHRDQRQPCDD
ncbi:MAG: hypothetical protein M0Z66_06465 [Thermaerobacter sp.]|nr:hypothetical protein [Thermaerobacter sp.]